MLPARPACIHAQPCFDLIVRQKCNVSGMRDRKHVPVSQQVAPRLKQPTDTDRPQPASTVNQFHRHKLQNFLRLFPGIFCNDYMTAVKMSPNLMIHCVIFFKINNMSQCSTCLIPTMWHTAYTPIEQPVTIHGMVRQVSAFGFLLLFWHAPLGVRSAIRRHQPPQRVVLSQVDSFVQCEVVGSQIVLDGFQSRDTRMPGGLFHLSGGGAIRIILAFWAE